VAEKKLLSLSDFEWASAARYIVYISSIANLKEVVSNRVVSFPLGRVGPEKLLKQKGDVLLALEGNKSNIERFVGEHKDDLEEEELAVLRTLYLQYKSSAEVVRGHIAIIQTCIVESQLAILQSQEVGSDDELF
jgi:hypothetical protein